LFGACQNLIAPIVPSGQLFPVFRLFIDDKIILQGQTIILSSRNNLNMGNTFVDLIEQVAQSNSDNSYVPQTDMLNKFRLYPDKS
jgi:hypothetical protein